MSVVGIEGISPITDSQVQMFLLGLTRVSLNLTLELTSKNWNKMSENRQHDAIHQINLETES